MCVPYALPAGCPARAARPGEWRARCARARAIRLSHYARYKTKNKLYGFTTWIYHGAALANRGAGFAVQSALSAVTKQVTPAPAHSPQPVWCCSAATSRYRPASSPNWSSPCWSSSPCPRPHAVLLDEACPISAQGLKASLTPASLACWCQIACVQSLHATLPPRLHPPPSSTPPSSPPAVDR